ncbi:MAG: YggT family protein [Pseudomonadota bacterium]
MQALFTLYEIISYLTNALVILIIAQFIIGLLFAFNVVSPSNQFLMQVYESLRRLLQPIYAPIQRIMPDTGAIDFSPMVLIFGLNIFLIILRGIIQSLAGV